MAAAKRGKQRKWLGVVWLGVVGQGSVALAQVALEDLAARVLWQRVGEHRSVASQPGPGVGVHLLRGIASADLGITTAVTASIHTGCATPNTATSATPASS